MRLDREGIPLKVLPGADVRIEPVMIEQLVSGDVLSLGNHRRHVLLELPHELYLPLEPVVDELSRRRMVGIFSHPERNEGILRRPDVLPALVEAGCLLQITAGSLCGTFGTDCKHMSERLLAEGLVHFVATDAHGPRSRRPLLRRAFERVAELTDETTAIDLCSRNPAAVAAGQGVRPDRRVVARRKKGWFSKKAVA
jgi:protein-tyrosine phosphatase